MDMTYITVAELAKRWNLSERTVRNYCERGKMPGAKQQGGKWIAPENSVRPERVNKKKAKRTLIDILREEKEAGYKGGIYRKIQIDFAYNSNHIEGSRLTHDQTRYIFETNTVGVEGEALNVDDISETVNHFKCVDFVIEKAGRRLTEAFIKQLHAMLKRGTKYESKSWFAVGNYKRLPNTVGDIDTSSPENVAKDIRRLLTAYNAKKTKTLDDILAFHHRFERIHPFQDGNGRVGRLIMFKECLRWGITPFIIEDDMKYFYYRGLAEWSRERGFLRDTCLAAQDRFKAMLKQFQIADTK